MQPTGPIPVAVGRISAVSIFLFICLSYFSLPSASKRHTTKACLPLRKLKLGIRAPRLPPLLLWADKLFNSCHTTVVHTTPTDFLGCRKSNQFYRFLKKSKIVTLHHPKLRDFICLLKIPSLVSSLHLSFSPLDFMWLATELRAKRINQSVDQPFPPLPVERSK